jgi:molybdopterin-containing oxidoreductase family membrane subunit
MYLTRYLAAIYSSEYALNFSVKAMYASSEFLALELFLGLIFPFIIILFVKENLANILGIVAIPALFGIMISRYNLVEGLQFIPKKDVKIADYSESIAPAFNYVPSVSEVALSLGGLGVCILLYFVSSVVWNFLTEEK